MVTVDQSSPDAIWAEVQAELRLQMTRATYEYHIQQARLLSNGNRIYKIQAGTQESQEWLEHRLKEKVVKAFATVLGYPVDVEFVPVNSSPVSIGNTVSLSGVTTYEADTSSSNTPPVQSVPVLSACARFALEVDFQSLWFAKGHSSGFTQVADYWLQFWMLFLNKIKPGAFDVWSRVVSDDKRNINDEGFTHWTPPRKYTFKELGRVVGTKSLVSVRGGPRSCWANEKNKAETGVALAACCQKYSPTRWHETANHTIRCEHWQTGILEVLYREGLIAVEIIKPPPGKPRSHEMRIQAWRNLPLLTPRQVSQLSEWDQLRHNQWLERYGHHQGIDLACWEQLTDAYSLVFFLPEYDLKPGNCPKCQCNCQPGCPCRCHKSRQFWEPFVPMQEWIKEDQAIER